MDYIQLNSEQIEYLNGNLLGDGGLTTPRSKNDNSRFYFGQSGEVPTTLKGRGFLPNQLLALLQVLCQGGRLLTSGTSCHDVY